ncbi:MAG: type II toxin-antitoxin system RelE/ParE family toxin [Myxococcota bacterium]|nr:type II toxin-antitoxin system RelE/ParE family toxin [Myxococcota bacterium]
MHTIYRTNRFKRSFKRIDKAAQRRIWEKIKRLAEDPWDAALNVKKLSGYEGLYRLRVGEYRVIFSIYDEDKIVILMTVGPRGDVYGGPKIDAPKVQEEIKKLLRETIK